MFETSIEVIKRTLTEFKGTGMYIALFFVSMLYILLKEKNKNMKVFFVFFPIMTLIVTLNPLFNKIVSPIFKASTYWRVYWLIPLGVEIAYAGILFIKEQEQKSKKIIAMLGICLIIAISGKYVYTKENFIKTGNWYKIPDEAVLVAQLIGSDEEENKKAYVPESLTAYIRQIDASIKLAYKREPTGYENHELVHILNSGDTEKIVKTAEEKECNYIVMNKAVKLSVDFYFFGFEKINETPTYVIYKKINS